MLLHQLEENLLQISQQQKAKSKSRSQQSLCENSLTLGPLYVHTGDMTVKSHWSICITIGALHIFRIGHRVCPQNTCNWHHWAGWWKRGRDVRNVSIIAVLVHTINSYIWLFCVGDLWVIHWNRFIKFRISKTRISCPMMNRGPFY